VLPLASVVSASVGVLDVMLWGGIAMGVQLLSFVLLNLCFPSLKKAIADGQTSAALLLAQMTLAIGILNAACMSW
jgi:putative membrane protein